MHFAPDHGITTFGFGHDQGRESIYFARCFIISIIEIVYTKYPSSRYATRKVVDEKKKLLTWCVTKQPKSDSITYLVIFKEKENNH